MPTSEGEASPTWRVNSAPPIEANRAATAKIAALNSGRVVAGEAHPVLAVAHRHQDLAQPAVGDRPPEQHGRHQQAQGR